MGIPSYFKWLVKHFEDDIISPDYPFEAGELDVLYLDYNGGIHPAVRSQPDNSLEDMYAAVLRYLDYLIDSTRPKRLVFLAIDGVAPAAKMKQQRSRRYKSVKEVVEINQLKRHYADPGAEVNQHQKDFNMISPATEFMTELSRRLVNHLKHHAQGQYQHLKFILTDSSVPGEGEHKILAHLRSQPAEVKCAIYGLDSDLIMLSLSTNRTHLVLVREDTLLKNNSMDLEIDKFPVLSYFSIDRLRAHIINIMNPYTSLGELEGLKIFSFDRSDRSAAEVGEVAGCVAEAYQRMQAEQFFSQPEDSIRLIRDYIFISFLLGNDFVPSFEALKIREGGIEQMLRAYKLTIQRQRDYLLTEQLTVNPDFLLELIHRLSQSERASLKKQKRARDYRAKTLQSSPLPRNLTEATQEYQSIDHLYDDSINVYRDGWEARYYQYFFHFNGGGGGGFPPIAPLYPWGETPHSPPLPWGETPHSPPLSSCPPLPWEETPHSPPFADRCAMSRLPASVALDHLVLF